MIQMFYASHLRTLVLFAVVVFLNTRADASLTYSLQFDGPTVVAPSSFFTINAFLVEQVTGASLTVLGDPVAGGLIQGNIAFGQTGFSAPFTPASLSGNSTFDTPGPIVAGPPIWSIVQSDLNPLDGTPTGTETAPGSGIYRLLLGSAQFQASSVVGEATTFTFQDFDALSDDLVLGDFTILDSIPGLFNASITVTAVPEPSSFALLGIAGLIGGYRLRRLRKISESKNVSPTTAS